MSMWPKKHRRYLLRLKLFLKLNNVKGCLEIHVLSVIVGVLTTKSNAAHVGCWFAEMRVCILPYKRVFRQVVAVYATSNTMTWRTWRDCFRNKIERTRGCVFSGSLLCLIVCVCTFFYVGQHCKEFSMMRMMPMINILYFEFSFIDLQARDARKFTVNHVVVIP